MMKKTNIALVWCASLRAELEQFHPLAPWVAVTLGIWLAVYAARRWFPRLWLPLTRWPDASTPASTIFQALPSVGLGAAWAAFTTPGGDVSDAALGALAGALAPLLHHAIKLAPGPYQGPLNDAANAAAQRMRFAGKTGARALLLFGVAFLHGCREFEPAHNVNQKAFRFQACELKALAEADERADIECPPAVIQWESCQARAAIMSELRADQEACK